MAVDDIILGVEERWRQQNPRKIVSFIEKGSCRKFCRYALANILSCPEWSGALCLERALCLGRFRIFIFYIFCYLIWIFLHIIVE